MKQKRSNQSFSNGVPELLILHLVSEREMYGYELIRAIHHVSGKNFSFEEGHIYPLLHTMEENGYLRSQRKEVNGKARLYYRLTPAGKARLERMIEDWARVRAGIDTLLKPTLP